ncbi:MAG: hypothetical protein HYZ63_01880 [Candidatus Andersenbacteria bacterium]|nr:hypothetical protein [Candidatus Andersenbacteria bacterium]
MTRTIEIVPAILRRTWEGIQEDWEKIYTAAQHIQIDITDGIFAGDGSFRELRMFKRLPQSEKIELHMMVHTPSNFVDDIIDLNPARCVFHVEAFAGTGDIEFVYKKLQQETQTDLALALSPASPNEWLYGHVALLHYVLFMGYAPGWAGQALDPKVFVKIGQFKEQYPQMLIAVDGHVDKGTIPDYVKAGATILCANSSVFKEGSPIENLRQLELIAKAALTA